MREYKELTVEDLVKLVEDKNKFPDGLKTKIYSGDFEGNYFHKKHEPFYESKKYIVLGYEMFEGKNTDSE